MFVRIITIQLSIIWQNLAADSKSHDGLNLSYNKKNSGSIWFFDSAYSRQVPYKKSDNVLCTLFTY